MTRGERNHNPLNIRKSPRTKWLGQCEEQHDREFVQFKSDLFGFRAAFRVLRSYLKLQHLVNLRQIIYRWAPPEDGNNTESYLQTVSQRSKVMPALPLTFESETELVAIVIAMAWVESGMTDVNPELVRKAYQMAK